MTLMPRWTANVEVNVRSDRPGPPYVGEVDACSHDVSRLHSRGPGPMVRVRHKTTVAYIHEDVIGQIEVVRASHPAVVGYPNHPSRGGGDNGLTFRQHEVPRVQTPVRAAAHRPLCTFRARSTSVGQPERQRLAHLPLEEGRVQPRHNRNDCDPRGDGDEKGESVQGASCGRSWRNGDIVPPLERYVRGGRLASVSTHEARGVQAML